MSLSICLGFLSMMCLNCLVTYVCSRLIILHTIYTMHYSLTEIVKTQKTERVGIIQLLIEACDWLLEHISDI